MIMNIILHRCQAKLINLILVYNHFLFENHELDNVYKYIFINYIGTEGKLLINVRSFNRFYV